MDHPIHKVTSFSIVAPYTLDVCFEDTTSRRIDLAPILQGEVYGPLKDLKLFEQVRLDPEVQTLVWPNGADFDPATLYSWPSEAAEVRAAAKHWGDQNPETAASPSGEA
jgi:hypothetical protein